MTTASLANMKTLAEAVAATTGNPVSTCKELLDHVFVAIEALISNPAEFSGLRTPIGTFSLKLAEAGVKRNPFAGTNVNVPARYNAKFKFATPVKNAIKDLPVVGAKAKGKGKTVAAAPAPAPVKAKGKTAAPVAKGKPGRPAKAAAAPAPAAPAKRGPGRPAAAKTVAPIAKTVAKAPAKAVAKTPARTASRTPAKAARRG